MAKKKSEEIKPEAAELLEVAEPIKKAITGDLTLKKADGGMVTFTIEGADGLLSSKSVAISRDMFPKDYEASRYDISGKITLEWEEKEKPKTARVKTERRKTFKLI
ncbi:MAG: hypothetical protein WC114_11220 [Smithellaceae bacterium]